jgi:predicted HTH domain antitoxin
MILTITIPDDFADVLGASPAEREVRAREALALELYREGRISLRRMGELAGVSGDYWAADRLRALHRVPLNYSMRDLHSDVTALDQMLGP